MMDHPWATVPGHRRPVADAGILGLPRDGTPQFPVAQAGRAWSHGALERLDTDPIISP